MKTTPHNTILLSLSLTLLLTSCTFAANEWWPEGKKTEKFTQPILLDTTPINRNTAPTISYANVVKKVTPSVVSIISMQPKPNIQEFIHPFLDDPFFRRFFGPDFFGLPDDEDPLDQRRFNRRPTPKQPDNRNKRRRTVPAGIGSGVVITSDGYIITNNHVVDNAEEIKVSFDGLKDGKREMTAKLIGADKRTDIALLKVDLQNLTPITLGDSDQLEVGDIVLAIGSPFKLTQTVTSGIVSALGRNITQGRETLFSDFIQTDAPINQGNSGGALVDIQGRLVGINTMIFSSTGGNIGIGFAIPTNTVRAITEQLITKGKVSRGFIGVSIQEITDDIYEANKLNTRDGALVSEVIEDSPAEKAGIKHGDIIIEFNGRPIDTPATLRRLVSNTPPGTPSQIKVLRDGKTLTLPITPKELPANQDGSPSEPTPTDNGDTTDQSALSGVELSDITPSLRERFNIPEKITGVVILSIEPDSPAAEAGLSVGDVIRDIGNKPVKNVNEAQSLLSEIKDKRYVLRVWSRETRGTRFVVVDEN